MNNHPAVDKAYKLANTPSINGWPHFTSHFTILRLDRQGSEFMKSGPYESPNEECKDPSVPPKMFTRRTVFWSGMTAVLVAVVGFNGSHALFVHLKSEQGSFDSVIAVIDIIALTSLAAGCIAMIASNWFPEARRKHSSRRN